VSPKTFMLLSAASLTFAACNRGDDQPATPVDDLEVENTVLTNDVLATTPATAQEFANAVAASDRFEIESSKLAASAAQSSAVKTFANNMIKAHTASTEKLKTTVAGLATPLTINDALTANQQQLLDGLKGKRGADLDAAYSAAQVSAHQATLDALNAYAASGDDPALKPLASEMIPTVTAHLNAAKGLR
jgi:putative membrane protein